MDESNNPTDAEISRDLVGTEDQIRGAIGEVDRKYREYLTRVVYSNYHGYLDPLETQEAVNKALQGLLRMADDKKYDPAKAKLTTFLAFIVLRKAGEIYKSKKKRNKREVELPEKEHSLPQAMTIPGETVLSQILIDEIVKKFKEFVPSLKGNQKLVGEICGRFLSEHFCWPSTKEIMAEAGATEESVKGSLREIRLKLREKNFYE